MSDKKNKIESEMDFGAILKNPMRMFGVIYIYFFLVAISIGIYFVWNMDSISFNTLQGSYLDSVIVVKDIPFKAGGMKPAVDLSLISDPTPEVLAKGKELFDVQCQTCHGLEGNGDGAAAAALNPPARNFHSIDGWTNGRNFSDMYKTLQEGIITRGMSPYDYIPAEDRIAIVHYIRSLADFPAVTEDEIVALDFKYQLSKGVMEANTIPLDMAVSNLVRENKKMVRDVAIKDTDSEGAQLLKKYSLDVNKTIKLFLLNSQNQTSLTDFVTAVTNNPEAIGFNNSIVKLTEAEWNSIFNYLKNYKT